MIKKMSAEEEAVLIKKVSRQSRVFLEFNQDYRHLEQGGEQHIFWVEKFIFFYEVFNYLENNSVDDFVVNSEIYKMTKTFIDTNTASDLKMTCQHLDIWQKTESSDKGTKYLSSIEMSNLSKADIDTLTLALELVKEYPHSFSYGPQKICYSEAIKQLPAKEMRKVLLELCTPEALKEHHQVYVNIVDGKLTYE